MFNDLGTKSLFATGLQVGGNLINAYSAFQSNKYNREATQWAMQTAMIQGEFAAQEAVKQGQFQRDQIREEGRRTAGSALAQGTAQGLDMTSGTGEALMREIINNSSADAMQAMLQGEVAAINARTGAQSQALRIKGQGTQNRAQAIVQGTNSLLGAVISAKEGIKSYQSAKIYKDKG
jgi:hypothetical protein